VGNRRRRLFVTLNRMKHLYDWTWVETEVARAMDAWSECASAPAAQAAVRFTASEQQAREKAYDAELLTVEREARRAARTKAERLETQDRIVASFARFAASALGLERAAVNLLTNDFLPAGTKLARWSKQFDASLSTADIMQACRNTWTACGLQALLGEPIRITPAIVGYSLLYPYSDNFLDRADVSREAKLRFSERFRGRLRGEQLNAADDRETAVWALVTLIEEQYPRADFPDVFACLLAIHRAQEGSIAQLRSGADGGGADVLRMSCAKGGSSVLADACLARGWMSVEESRFSFAWGVLLQLGDDLQDLREDMQRGSVTLFSRGAETGIPLDGLVMQLLSFSDRVANQMYELTEGTETLKKLMRMSWRSLIIGAVANAHEFFSPAFVMEAERSSPFRFEFLRSRHERLTSKQGLYTALFDAFYEAREDEDELPRPACPIRRHR
jgi:hypothetical protein